MDLKFRQPVDFAVVVILMAVEAEVDAEACWYVVDPELVEGLSPYLDPPR